MKLRELLLAITFIAFAVVLPACGVGSGSTGTTGFGGSPGAPVTLSVSPIPTSIPVNSIVNFTAATSSTAPATWTLVNASLASVGTLTYPNGTNTAQYTAPPTPPIYPTGNVTSAIQGNIILNVEAYNSSGTGTLEQYTIPITAPSITAGIAPATASVALGSSQYFSGYAVGGVNNGIVFTVNGIVNGNATVGTINALGDYIAPTTMPMSGSTVTIVCTSAADPTKSAAAVVTLH